MKQGHRGAGPGSPEHKADRILLLCHGSKHFSSHSRDKGHNTLGCLPGVKTSVRKKGTRRGTGTLPLAQAPQALLLRMLPDSALCPQVMDNLLLALTRNLGCCPPAGHGHHQHLPTGVCSQEVLSASCLLIPSQGLMW